MKNINSKYCLCRKGSFEPIFISDSITLKDFIKDVEQYFNYLPSCKMNYRIEIIECKISKNILKKEHALMFTNINIIRINSHIKDEYYIYEIPIIEKNKGITMGWDICKSKRILK
jgi:hypothetical protein